MAEIDWKMVREGVLALAAAGGLGSSVYQSQAAPDCSEWVAQIDKVRAAAESREIRDSDECHSMIATVRESCQARE